MTHEDTLNNAHWKAIQALREASEAFTNALDSLVGAIETEQRAHLRLIEYPADAMRHLASIAMSNRSSWSGGPHSSTNIIEALKRNAAIEALRQVRS